MAFLVAKTLQLSITLGVFRVRCPIALPVVRILFTPSLLGGLLVGFVIQVIGKFLFAPALPPGILTSFA
jgi:hypothetical protein